MLKLKNKISVIIPVNDNNGVKIENQFINDTISDLIGICGGATVYDNNGAWVSENGGIMKDENKEYEFYYNKGLSENIVFNLIKIIFPLINIHGQEGVSIKINNILYILENEDFKDTPKLRKYLINKLEEGC